MVTIEEFIKRMKEVKKMGYVETHRTGPTGIGKTLEDLLNIKENNIQGPDFGKYELKASRKTPNGATNSMITLFTKSPEPRGANGYLLNKYGYVANHSGERKILHETLFMTRFTRVNDTGVSLKVEADNKRVYIVAKTDREENNSEEYNRIYWPRETIQEYIERKLKNLVYVKADYRINRAGKEEFRFNEAFLLSDSRFSDFVKLLRSGDICVDVRIGQYQNGRTHDHGTGFRMNKWKLDLLYSKRKKLI